MCGYCKVWMCECMDFMMCECVCVDLVMSACVYVLILKTLVCVCVRFLRCGRVYV